MRLDGPSSRMSQDGSGAGDLVVVCGLPGVGKTTVAERVADHVDARILRTDVIRKELFPEPTYAEEETEAVYEELLDRARARVAEGESVVLDATFADARFRAAASETADRVADRFALVKVECEESVVEERIRRRDGISDADFDVHLHFKETFDRIDTGDSARDTDGDVVVVDNSGDEAETRAQVDVVFG
nr:AAA family ATPase [Halorubrum aethiopicum]